MKKIYLFILAVLCSSLQVTSQICGPNCSFYTVTPVTPTITSFAPTATMVTLGDDQLSSFISLPASFAFTFYCTPVSGFKISSNGFITFDAGTFNSGCCSGGILPDAPDLNNAVSWSWNDMNPSAGGQIGYDFEGVAPNRVAVITWSNVPHFGAGAPDCTGQIRLYETSNLIEVHNLLVSNDGSEATQGIENAMGTIGMPAPGRNSSFFTASNDAYRWTPWAGGPQPPAPIMGPDGVCAGTIAEFSVAPVAGATNYNWLLPAGWTSTISANSITVNPTSPGIVSVSATYSCGTSGYATQSFTIYPNPTITITGGDSTICAGQSLTLTATGADYYNWSNWDWGPVSIVTPSVSETFTCGASTFFGCTGQAVTSVTVIPLPAVAVNPMPGTQICNGQSITLNGSGASSYTWSTGSNSATITETPSLTTSYTLTGEDAGCAADVVVNITVNPLPALTVTGSTVICSGQAATLTCGGADTYSWSTGATSPAIIVTPSATTNYTVTGTNSLTGCPNSSTFALNVNTQPTVNVTGISTICAGQSTSLTASGAATYSWSNGSSGNSVTVSPVSSQMFTVSGTTNGCTDSYSYSVTVNPNPTIIVASSTPSLCVGGTATLLCGGADTYTWAPVTGASNTIAVNPAVTTQYTISGTYTLTGCSSFSTVSIMVDPCDGIEEQYLSAGMLTVYPNPSDHLFAVKMLSPAHYMYEVTDVLGKTVLTGSGNGFNDMIDLAEAEKGIYYLKVISDNKVYIAQLIKY